MSNIKLSRVCKIKGGSGFPERYQGASSGRYPFIKVSDMNLPENTLFIRRSNNYVDEQIASLLNLNIFPEGTTVFAKVGAAIFLNRRRILSQNTIIDNNMMGLIPHNINGIFLYHFFSTIDLGFFVQPGVLPSINQQIIGNITIPEFSLEQQSKIAEILTTVDNLIEQTEAAIAKYQSIKQGMMHDLFTRGVDANGHLRPPREEAPELYKESELGWIPKEWDVILLSTAVPSATYGISHSLDDDTGTPVLRMNNLHDGTVDLTSIKSSNRFIHDNLLLKYNDVLFNRTNSMEHVGRTSIWKNQLPRATFASYIVRLNLDTNTILPEFLVFWLNQKSIQNEIRKFSTPGVHQVNINPKNLRKTKLSLPTDTNEQQAITAIITGANERLLQEVNSLAKMLKLKSGLMQDLLSGRVSVTKDAATTQEPRHAS